MARLRVLILTAHAAVGGPLPKLAPLVAEGLRAGGCDVTVEGWSAHRAGQESLPVKVIERAWDLLRVHYRIRAWRPDVIYVATAHDWSALVRDVPLVLSVRKGRPPLVMHLHGSECDRLGRPGQRAFTMLSRLLVRRSASVMLLSEEERRSWRRACPGGVFHVVLNPYDGPHADVTPSASGPSYRGSTPTLLVVARLIPEKGVMDLVEAFAIVRRRRACRLVIAGTGPAKDDLCRLIADLGLDDHVELLGYVSGPRLAEAYRQADLFVLPTYHHEGLPLSVMEAMGYGLPIVTTPIRGLVDQLVPGENALFVRPREPQALARSIKFLLDDGALRRTMGRANEARVAQFAAERVMPAYVAILKEAAGRS